MWEVCISYCEDGADGDRTIQLHLPQLLELQLFRTPAACGAQVLLQTPTRQQRPEPVSCHGHRPSGS